MKGLGFSEFIIELMMNLSQGIRQGHAEEVTNTVGEVLGRPPIRFSQFVEDHRDTWL